MSGREGRRSGTVTVAWGSDAYRVAADCLQHRLPMRIEPEPGLWAVTEIVILVGPPNTAVVHIREWDEAVYSSDAKDER